MKLSRYLIMHGIGPTDFARKIHVRSRMTVHRYIRGERIPSPIIMARIVRVTKGAVTPADFANDNHSFMFPQACPEQDNFPWKRRERELCQRTEQRLQQMLTEEPKEGDCLSPPLKRAVEVLQDRIRLGGEQSEFWLDQRPVDAQTMVRRANAILADTDEPLIHYPGIHSRWN